MIVDTALLGRYSTAALASVAVAVPVYLLAVIVLRAVATATQVLVARRFGADRRDEIGPVAAAGLVATVLGGAALAVVLIVTAPLAVGLLGDDPALLGAGATYLWLVAGRDPVRRGDQRVAGVPMPGSVPHGSRCT